MRQGGPVHARRQRRSERPPRSDGDVDRGDHPARRPRSAPLLVLHPDPSIHLDCHMEHCAHRCALSSLRLDGAAYGRTAAASSNAAHAHQPPDRHRTRDVAGVGPDRQHRHALRASRLLDAGSAATARSNQSLATGRRADLSVLESRIDEPSRSAGQGRATSETGRQRPAPDRHRGRHGHDQILHCNRCCGFSVFAGALARRDDPKLLAQARRGPRRRIRRSRRRNNPQCRARRDRHFGPAGFPGGDRAYGGRGSRREPAHIGRPDSRHRPGAPQSSSSR